MIVLPLLFLQDEVDDAKKLKASKNGSSAHDDESNGADENGAEEEEDLDEEAEEALGEEEEGDGEEDLDEAEGEEGEGGSLLSTHLIFIYLVLECLKSEPSLPKYTIQSLGANSLHFLMWALETFSMHIDFFTFGPFLRRQLLHFRCDFKVVQPRALMSCNHNNL